MQAPVLISGAGPSGLVLALSLRKNGIPVRIIDKESGPRLGERGAGVSPRSLELHKILGTFADVYGDGKPIPLRRDYDPLDSHKPIKTYAMVPVMPASTGVPHANAIFVGQNHHERILRAHLKKLGTNVEFGTELCTFTQSADNVTVEMVHRTADGKEEVHQATVSWLIGTDGAHSVVRKTLGLEFMGETREGFEMVIGDFRTNGEPREFWEHWGDQTEKIAFTRTSSQDPDVMNFLIAGRVDIEKILSSPQETMEEFYNISGRRDIILEDVIWSSKYRPNIRMVKELRVGRVFIAGDAAHCHSPTGGQGLNSSIQDSFNLGWKLALVQRGLSSESLLDTYAEERLPVIAEMLNKTTELLNERLGPAEAEPSLRNTNIREDMTQLGITYRGSPIILQEGAGGPLLRTIGYNKSSVDAAQPGDRAPEAPNLTNAADGKTLSLFKLLSPSHHSVFIFDSYSSEDLVTLSEVLRQQPENTISSHLIETPQGTSSKHQGKFDNILIDDKGHAYATYKIAGPCIIVVRPDGVIGARVKELSGVEKYFGGIFIKN